MNRTCLLLALTHLAGSALITGHVDGSPSDSHPISLTGAEQQEWQNILAARAGREREYREAVLVAQVAQARLEVANGAVETQYYKLCGKYKLDPANYEVSPDGKQMQPKLPTKKDGAPGK
jgi:hypothetical protein